MNQHPYLGLRLGWDLLIFFYLELKVALDSINLSISIYSTTYQVEQFHNTLTIVLYKFDAFVYNDWDIILS